MELPFCDVFFRPLKKVKFTGNTSDFCKQVVVFLGGLPIARNIYIYAYIALNIYHMYLEPPRFFTVKPSELRILSVLGSGAHANVYKARRGFSMREA